MDNIISVDRIRCALTQEAAKKEPGKNKVCGYTRGMQTRVDCIYHRQKDKVYFYCIDHRAEVQLLERVEDDIHCHQFKRMGSAVPCSAFTKIQQARGIQWADFIEEFINLEGDAVDLYRIMYTLA